MLLFLLVPIVGASLPVTCIQTAPFLPLIGLPEHPLPLIFFTVQVILKSESLFICLISKRVYLLSVVRTCFISYRLIICCCVMSFQQYIIMV
jgi:hypothetical protein